MILKGSLFLKKFAELDDYDILASIKVWAEGE